MRGMQRLACQKMPGIHPYGFEVVRAPKGTLEAVGFIHFPFSIEQDIKRRACLIQPGLYGRQCPKRNNEHTSIQPAKFFLQMAQLGHMFPTGDSTQMAKKDKQSKLVLPKDVFQ